MTVVAVVLDVAVSVCVKVCAVEGLLCGVG